MNKKILLGLVSLALTSNVYASGHDGNCTDRECQPKTKEVCFNLYCDYDLDTPHDHHDHYDKPCTAASTFTKKVTEDGAEVPESLDGNLEIKCDGQSWIGRADIFTGLLGSRFQTETGPNPAIFLPRGSLTAGCENNIQGHYSTSGIELNDHGKFIRGEGKCFIWTTEKDSHDHSPMPAPTHTPGV